jgi:hypothetical protein
MVQHEISQTGSPELRKKLPRGAIKEIAQELGISWIWAFKVISGKVNGDPRIIALAIEHAKIADEKRARLANMIERNRQELEVLI